MIDKKIETMDGNAAASATIKQENRTAIRQELQQSIRQNRNLNNDVIEIDLKEMFQMLLGNWKVILLITLIGATLAGAYHTFIVTPTYQAEAQIYITSSDSVISLSELQLSAALTEDYALIVKSRTVMNLVIEKMDLDLTYKQLQNLVTVTNPSSTHIITIAVTCDDLELARDITNTLLLVSVDQIYQIVGNGQPTVIDYAEAEAVEDVTPSLEKYMAIGGLLAMMLICAFLVVRMLLDVTLRSEEDVEKYLGLPVLSSVPYYQVKAEKRSRSGN